MKIKEKIIIFVADKGAFRNFIEVEAFSNVESEFEVYYLYDEYFGLDSSFFPVKETIAHNFNHKEPYFKRIFIEMYSFRKINVCSTWEAQFKSPQGKYGKKYYIYKVLTSSNLIYRLLVRLFGMKLGIDRTLFNKIKKVMPSFIILPIGSFNTMETDIMRICKKLKIKTIVISATWDSVSSKMWVPIKPDFVFERGQQNVEMAKRILEMKNFQLAKIGVPRYERFLNFQRKFNLKDTRISYLTKMGISTEKDVVLFGGSLRPFDETSFLEKLELAIEEGIFKNMHIIYRPHPCRSNRIKEKSFFDCNFKHISFDEEMKQAYINKNKNFLPSLDSYENLYNSIFAIICPPTSIIVEVALFGKPILAMVCDDGVHKGWTSAQAIIKREHFKSWDKFYWFLKCYKKESFIDDCKKLFQIAKTPGINEEIKRDIRENVYYDEKSYSQRIVDSINSLCIKESYNNAKS